MGVGNVGIGIVGEVEGTVAAAVGLIFDALCTFIHHFPHNAYYYPTQGGNVRTSNHAFTTVELHVALSSFGHDFLTCTTLCKKLTKSSASSVAAVVVLLGVVRVAVQLVSIIGAGVA